MTVIGELIAGKALEVVLCGVVGALRAYLSQDDLGRLLVLLHADFGERSELGRDAFFQWRTDDGLEQALRAVLGGQRPTEESVSGLASRIAPHLVRTEQTEREILATEIARASFEAAPSAADGGSGALALVLSRVEAGQREVLEAIGRVGERPEPDSSNLARALVVGPLQQIGALDEVDTAERQATEGNHAAAADDLLGVATRLVDGGLTLAAESVRERAAAHLAASGDPDGAAEILVAVALQRVERGSWSLARLTIHALRALLSPARAWLAHALEARAHWPERGQGAIEPLAQAAMRSAGRSDHLEWLSFYIEMLLIHGQNSKALEAAAEIRRDALAEGPRFRIELDCLDALGDSGDSDAAEAGWLRVLRWADEAASAPTRATAWQRRGLALASRERVLEAHDAYRRAMAAWAEVPGFEEQAADALFCLQAVSIVNAQQHPDPELRPLAYAIRGGTSTPTATAERLAHEGMSRRLEDRLPDALTAYWTAWAIHRRVGSLQGVLETGERIAELYAHAGEPAIALAMYVRVGKGKEAADLAQGVGGRDVADHLEVGQSRWQRGAAYEVIAEVGRELPPEYVADLGPRLIDESSYPPDGWVAPQPSLAARRALASVALAVPEELRPATFARLHEMLGDGWIDQVRGAAEALTMATTAGLTNARPALVERYLDDPYNYRIDPLWLADQASDHSSVRNRLREAAQEGHAGALEVLVVADLVDDDHLREFCDREAERGAEVVTIEEREEPGGSRSVSVGRGIRLERFGIIARGASDESRGRLLERLLAILESPREPEGNRASAAGAIFNMAPGLTSEQAEQIRDVIVPLALGRYEPSEWDRDENHPLGRFKINLHVPNQLRTTAIGTLAQLVAKHHEVGEGELEEAVAAATREEADVVIAAAFDAAARIPALELPLPIEAGLTHASERVRYGALIAWAVRNTQLPPRDLVERLLDDDSSAVRFQLMMMAAESPNGEALLKRISATDSDAYVRVMASKHEPPVR